MDPVWSDHGLSSTTPEPPHSEVIGEPHDKNVGAEMDECYHLERLDITENMPHTSPNPFAKLRPLNITKALQEASDAPPREKRVSNREAQVNLACRAMEWEHQLKVLRDRADFPPRRSSLETLRILELRDRIWSRRRACPDVPKRNVFPFLSLPRELRDRIYRYAFVRPRPVYDMRPFSDAHRSRGQRPVPGMRFLVANKQVSAEAYAVFWRDNVFLFEHLQQQCPAEPAYLRDCVPDMRRLHVVLDSDFNSRGARINAAALDALHYLADLIEDCSRIEALTVEFRDALRVRWRPGYVPGTGPMVIEDCFRPLLARCLTVMTARLPRVRRMKVLITNTDANRVALWEPWLAVVSFKLLKPCMLLMTAKTMEEFERAKDRVLRDGGVHLVIEEPDVRMP